MTALAATRGVSIADLARAVLLLVPPELLAAAADPGEPAKADREEIVLKTGAGKDRRLRRKPRLQARLTGDHRAADLRRALGLALDLAHGRLRLRLERGGGDAEALHGEEIARLRQTVKALAFEPLGEDIRMRSEALYVLGFPPWALPSKAELRTRFRALATVYHPDSLTGDTLRMAQLNAAIAFLSRG